MKSDKYFPLYNITWSIGHFECVNFVDRIYKKHLNRSNSSHLLSRLDVRSAEVDVILKADLVRATTDLEEALQAPGRAQRVGRQPVGHRHSVDRVRAPAEHSDGMATFQRAAGVHVDARGVLEEIGVRLEVFLIFININ